MSILVTGGAGFIGSNFVLDWLEHSDESVINLDLLTYAGNLENLSSLKDDSRHHFMKGDIGDRQLVTRLLKQYQPRAVINFAAESHVDRSIHGPANFIQTNIVGTFNLLECAREYWAGLRDAEKKQFRFLPMYQQMRYTAHYLHPIRLFQSLIHMSQTAHIQHQKLPQIIWCGHGFIPMDCL